MELSNKELDIAFDQGILEGVLQNAPDVVKASLKSVCDGVQFYRDKFFDAETKFLALQEQYNMLTALSSQYLAVIQQQRNQIDQLLVEQQAPYHKTEE